MASVKGIPFEVGGRSFRMKIGVNAMCDIENSLGRPISSVAEDLQSGVVEMKVIRAIFAASVTPSITTVEAGDMIDELGMEEAGQLIGPAFMEAFPAADGQTANPRKAAAA